MTARTARLARSAVALLGVLAALAILAPTAVAADRKPVVIGASGQQQQIQSGDAVGVAVGGTGLTSFTAHCVLIGAGTSAAHIVCPGTSGDVLASNGPSADPTFQTPAGGSGSPGGSSGQIQYNNAGALGGFTLGGDCTFSVPNITCTKTGGTLFGYFATGTDAANLTGTLSASRIAAAALSLGKIANASANSVLLGAGATGSGSSYSEISLGSGLTMTGTTLSAAGGVSTTGSPASGNIAKFSGASSITNGDLSGDCATSGTLSLTCTLPVGHISSIAANSVVGNATGSSAPPSPLSVPNCSGAANGLIWTAASGFGCNTFGSGTGSPGALTLLEAHTASASATLDFTSWQSSSYDEYLIEFINITPSTTGLIFDIRASTNGGSTWDSSTVYYTSQFAWSSAGSTVNGVGAGTALVAFPLNPRTMSTTATQGLSGQIRMYTGSGLYTQFLGDLLGPDSVDPATTPQAVQMRGFYTTSSTINGLRFFTTSNAFSGTVRIYGVSH